MTFDTSGVVLVQGEAKFPVAYEWSDLTPFVQGYVEAMLQELGAVKESRAEGYYLFCGFSDLAPETLARIMSDCEQAKDNGFDDWRAGFTGKYFWEARQRGNMAFAPLTPFLGNDGKVYLKE